MYDIMEKKSKEDDFMDKVKKWFFDEDADRDGRTVPLHSGKHRSC